MNKIMMTAIFFFITGLTLAQNRTKDESGINSAVDAMIYSWNHHNYDDLKNYATEDTDWVNAVGMWWKGRKESQYAHQIFHDTMFKEGTCEKQSVTIRFITKDVAIAHIYWHFGGNVVDPSGRKLEPVDCIATVVYVNQKGKWLMEAGENLPIIPEVQQDDPIKRMPKN
ncbi:MAG TPA: SgcJ/EcaC family oxidoreductase [Cyclobacteriaceae bacterium]|jgi:uncharacterized protein (TIGR02246 family)|nr:SgcJ/EcaC family oxidoreductase [Cyclobacteriaceae bacterium]